MAKADLLDEVLVLLKEKKGIDFSGYRRSLLRRSLQERLLDVGCQDPTSYLQRLHNDGSEQDYLLHEFTINYSRLFRNPLVFEILAERVIPQVMEQKSRSGQRELRVWSAGCAAGEEACSIAILIHQNLAEVSSDWTTHLFATDIDQESLGRADQGSYPRSACSDVKLGVLDQYFIPDGDQFTVCSSIREMIRYSYHDLTSVAPADSVFGTFDLVLCRNVLIYFSKELQDRVFDKIYRSVSKQGYLVLGESECLSMELESKFVEVDRELRIYRRTA